MKDYSMNKQSFRFCEVDLLWDWVKCPRVKPAKPICMAIGSS